jgi:hypothetical protein
MRELGAANEDALGKELDLLQPKENGWISFDDFARLFASDETSEGPGEFDQAGSREMAAFAAGHRCRSKVVQSERKIYFTKDV